MLPAVPVLSGLERTQLISSTDPLLVFTSAFLLGAFLHSVAIDRWFRPSVPSVGPTPIPRQQIASLAMIYSLAIWLCCHALWQAWPIRSDPVFVDLFWHSASIGYASKYYWLASAQLWLIGLLLVGEWLILEIHLAPWIRPVIVGYIISISGFAFIQRLWTLPETQWVWTGARLLTSPYEDIHSFGAITIALFLGILGNLSYRTGRYTKTVVALMGSTVCLTLAIASWSRAAWAAGIIGISILTCLHLRKRWIVALMFGVVFLLALGNHLAKQASWERNQYLWRLGTLIRFENPLAKDPVRAGLYHKAIAMIAERPIVGHGIGSFFLKSQNYGAPADPYRGQPNFAHNFLLQISAELGLPAMILFMGLISTGLYRGYRASRFALQSPDRERLAVGLTIALTGYLITQMTANAINIYLSNQLFFWPLLGALLLLPSVENTKVRESNPT